MEPHFLQFSSDSCRRKQGKHWRFMKHFQCSHLCDLAPANILHLFLHISSVQAALSMSFLKSWQQQYKRSHMFEFYRWGNWGLVVLSNLSKDMKLSHLSMDTWLVALGLYSDPDSFDIKAHIWMRTLEPCKILSQHRNFPPRALVSMSWVIHESC